MTRKTPSFTATSKLVNNLFRIADAREMTLKDLSEKTGVKDVMLSWYRSGRSQAPIDRVEALADALGYAIILKKIRDDEPV